MRLSIWRVSGSRKWVPILVRFGKAPKRAIIFRCDEPFPKIVVNLIAPDGSNHKLEFLSDGQQLVVAGVHPDTGAFYTWHGNSTPGKVLREDLPYIRGEDARQLVTDSVAVLVERFGFKLAGASGKSSSGNGGNESSNQPADWDLLVSNIVTGANLHDSIVRLAASCVGRGWRVKQTIEFLQGLLNANTGPRDDRWKDRFRGNHPRCEVGL